MIFQSTLLYIICFRLLLFCFYFSEGRGVAEKVLEGMNGQSKKESQRDRLVRLGLMTPFGTVIKAGQKTPSSAPTTDFERFLAKRDSKGGKKKPMKKVLNQSTHHGSSKKTRLGSSSTAATQNTPSSSQTKAANRFDEKDFRNYNREVDYTEKRFQRKRQYKMEHDFSEDPQLSGDEYQDEDGQCLESDEDYMPDGRDMRHLSEPDTENEDSGGRR